MAYRILTALPVYNESRHIDSVLSEVCRYASDVLVIDDGSNDETPEILASRDDCRVMSHPHNMGYGAALRTAFEYAIAHEYDILVTIDCDGQHEPRLINDLASSVFPTGGEPVDIVSGSRYLAHFEGDSSPPEDRMHINRCITNRLNRTLGLNLTDSFCGFKAYRVEALKSLNITSEGYAMPLQLWVQAVAQGLSIEEFPVPLVYLEEKRSFGGLLDDSEQRRAYYLEVLVAEMESQREHLDRVFPCGQ